VDESEAPPTRAETPTERDEPAAVRRSRAVLHLLPTAASGQVGHAAPSRRTEQTPYQLVRP